MNELLIGIIALLILVIDIRLLFINRKNPFFLLMNFIILYFDYSILQGQYLMHNIHITNNDIEFNFYYLYERELILFLIFAIIKYFFLRKKIVVIDIEKKTSVFLFICNILAIIYIGFFEINRSFSFDYEVKISALFEYSVIFFILGNYFCPKNIKYKACLLVITLFFVLQDLYYGGRITSLQIIIVTVLFNFKYLLTIRKLVIPFVSFTFLFSVIGIIRSNPYLSLGDIYDKFIEKLLVLDTAVYAYFGSVTQLYAAENISFGLRLESFISFVLSIVFGSSIKDADWVDYELSLVTSFSSDFHWNAGGGMIFSYYYFWLGYFGVIVFTWGMFRIILNLYKSKNVIHNLVFICALATLPRWYLYTPLSLYRGTFFLFPIVCWLSFFLYKRFIRN